MSLPIDIMRAWVRPRQVMAGHIARGVNEARALMYLLLACVLIAISQIPRMAAEAEAMGDIPFEARISALIFGWFFVMPLLAYLVAAMTRLIAMLWRGQGTWATARLALFWALLVASPFWLLDGLLTALSAPQLVLNVSGTVVVILFLSVWVASLFQAEFNEEDRHV